jgi:hypothetical protein
MGTYSGTNSGLLVLDLDDIGSSFQGPFFAYDNNPALPRTCALIEIEKDKNRLSSRVPLMHVEQGSATFLSDADVTTRFPGVSVPKYADINWTLGPSSISVTWTTDIGTNGRAQIFKSAAGEPSALKAEAQSWEEFNAFVRTLEPYQFAFRGHTGNQWRLRTSFHRTGRADLWKFMAEDVASLHRHLSGLTTHRFQLNDPFDYAAFSNLAQHHGYPTPLLDWTQSPFVAAYFAFRDARSKRTTSSDKVRVFVLDARAWSALGRAFALMPGFIHLTLLEPLAINNPRALPQQSISAWTNVDDLESFIERTATWTGKSYLKVIDLPARERKKAMQDLALMGITAGSMFPGLDGACQRLKERYFGL